MKILPHLNFYLSKYGFLAPQLAEKPDPDLGIIVVIPSFNEPDLLSSLKALAACACPKKKAEVLVVINSGVDHAAEIKRQNKRSLEAAQHWLSRVDQSHIAFHFIVVEDLPQKHAGVGLARKIGMDEAVARFEQVGHDGIIACFDADCACDPNFLVALETHFEMYPKTPGCSVYFEHPLTGTESEIIYTGITNYELHLRYYNLALRFCQLPYAFHTVGSSMAVRSSAYQKQGGMNRRKAGEDFYFLHKIIGLGNFTELNDTRIIPSPRVSDRVPFGTGKAIGDFIQQQQAVYRTYHFNSFRLIRQFAGQIPQLYHTEPADLNNFDTDTAGLRALHQFLETESLQADLAGIRSNSSSEKTFIKRFWAWFDAFRVLKLVHFLRDQVYENAPLVESCNRLLEAYGHAFRSDNETELLHYFRSLEKIREEQ